MAYDINTILDYQFLNNSIQEYIYALVLVVLGMAVLHLTKRVLLRRLKKIAEKTVTDIDDLIINLLHQNHWPLYFVLSLFIAIQLLSLPELIGKLLRVALIVGVAYYIARVIISLVDYGILKIVARTEGDKNVREAYVVKTIGNVIKGVIWLIAVLIVFSSLGYDVTALVAGLGIGGLAIAFAFQKILEDIFSSISIYLDKPFEVGDFIVVGESLGVVKKIGIKTTRIKALQGEEIVISNREITSARIQNFRKLKKRRVVFNVGATYNTSNTKLNKVLEIVKNAVDKTKLAELDRVHFNEFGDFNLKFEIVYYLNSSNYAAYMDAQQEINLAIKAGFEKEKIEFAYPTQTLYLNK